MMHEDGNKVAHYQQRIDEAMGAETAADLAKALRDLGLAMECPDITQNCLGLAESLMLADSCLLQAGYGLYVLPVSQQ